MYNIENELVRQKDTIIALVNEGEYEKADVLLSFSKELWEKASYGYKYREILDRIYESVRHEYNTVAHWQHRQKWEKLMNKLDAKRKNETWAIEYYVADQRFWKEGFTTRDEVNDFRNKQTDDAFLRSTTSSFPCRWQYYQYINGTWFQLSK